MSDQAPSSAVSADTSAVIFLVMRRMRTPLIVLICIFAISVTGMALVPGLNSDGTEWHMGIFDSFYFMSYTATTIGFGEIPRAFSTAQRLWVVFSIYLTVIGWAYAFGSLLSLIQQATFKRALAVQRFRRRVRRLNEPFWLIAGHGEAGEVVGRTIDGLGGRFVALDLLQDRVDVLELGSYSSDVPALVGDVRDPDLLRMSGIENPTCNGVLALTDDEEANLAVVMAASVLRPGIPVVARCLTADVERRMGLFGSPTVINPFDRFGDQFRIELRAPAAEQLARWLTSAPGEPLPQQHDTMRSGSWVVCGYGRFGRELVTDLRADGLDVTVVDGNQEDADARVLRGDATDPEFLRSVGVTDAAGFVAGTDNDVTNLSMIAAARKANPEIMVVARQNLPRNAELFEAMHVDLLMVPSDVVAHEALTHIGAPRLQQFLVGAAKRDEEWATAAVARIVDAVGEGSPYLWTVGVGDVDAPALARVAAQAVVTMGDLVRDPVDRDSTLDALVLMRVRADDVLLMPPDDADIRPGDSLLLAGTASAQHSLDSTLFVDSSAVYALTGAREGAGWLWRTLA